MKVVMVIMLMVIMLMMVVEMVMMVVMMVVRGLGGFAPSKAPPHRLLKGETLKKMLTRVLVVWVRIRILRMIMVWKRDMIHADLCILAMLPRKAPNHRKWFLRTHRVSHTSNAE